MLRADGVDVVPPKDLSLCCGVVNRGLAMVDSLLFVGTVDGHLLWMLEPVSIKLLFYLRW
ncbi:MAG: hypothetical protein DMG06_29630 [Acidobacteria bacterium]|nr:MAG: hypothetical protein DMG06_29630 [Acidobacteriota bacterium]